MNTILKKWYDNQNKYTRKALEPVMKLKALSRNLEMIEREYSTFGSLAAHRLAEKLSVSTNDYYEVIDRVNQRTLTAIKLSAIHTHQAKP